MRLLLVKDCGIGELAQHLIPCRIPEIGTAQVRSHVSQHVQDAYETWCILVRDHPIGSFGEFQRAVYTSRSHRAALGCGRIPAANLCRGSAHEPMNHRPQSSICAVFLGLFGTLILAAGPDQPMSQRSIESALRDPGVASAVHQIDNPSTKFQWIRASFHHRGLLSLPRRVSAHEVGSTPAPKSYFG